ncbi:MAG: PEGA domain-containing protein [Polyangiaceae bacterium]|nr:PEGA domain-containing protein [Polyangiaceae bacterium]
MKRIRIAILAALVVFPSLAFAEPPSSARVANATIPSLSDSLSGDAKADYESGKILYADGDFASALVKFTNAYDKSKDARLEWNMAACEKNLRHYARAIKLVRGYLANGGDKLTPQDRVDAEELINVLEPLTAKLKITVSEPDADVTVDDESLGQSPVEPLMVDIGTRKLHVKKAQFEEVVRDVVVGNAEVTVDVRMVKIVHQGRVHVRAPSDAAVYVDGHLVGTGNWSGVLPSGGHTLRVTKNGMRPYQSEVLVSDNQVRDIEVTLEPEPSKGIPAAVWVVGGIVLAGGLVTGGVFLFKKSDAKYDGPIGNLSPGIVQSSVSFRR